MVDSRAALLNAAAEEFARRGLDGARIRVIVKRAGVNERMIYHHFGSKARLYHAVLETHREIVCSAWEPVLDEARLMTPYAGMRAALAGYFDLLIARPAVVGVMLHEGLRGWCTRPSLVSAVCVNALRELYTRGQDEGVFRVDCSFEVASLTAAGALFGVLGLTPHVLACDARSLRDQILAQLLDGMSGPG
jgi:AcrR family transcriptional regulator